MKQLTLYIAILTTVLSLNSCLFYKDIVNFQDGQDLGEGKLDSIMNFSKWTIDNEDILMVNVYSSNPEAASQFNIMDMSRGGGGMAQMTRTQGLSETIIGYRVDSEGNIDIPVIGKVKAKGKTIEEVKRDVEQKIKDTNYLKDVNVQVTYMTFRVTVLGEVNAPGSHILMSQRINILEAIGMAHDMTIFANRDNVLVIREKDNVRSYGRLNLKSKDIFDSPYFYLQPGDVVYVEPHPAKIMSAPDPASRYISSLIGVATLITLILTL